MEGNNALAAPDRGARVQFLFRQQLRRLIDAEPIAEDPHEVYRDRVWELELQYTFSPHYLQSDFRETYAHKHAAELITRRDDILASFRAFHQDTAFIAYLRQYHPHLYLLSKWETICLALAEKYEAAALPDGSLPPTPAPAKKKPTPEEVRAHMVRRQQVQADDKIALAKDRIEAVLKARQFLDRYDLDEDERQQYERELTADIMAGQEEPTTNHKRPTTGYKQL
jgi:hypothetical protein